MSHLQRFVTKPTASPPSGRVVNFCRDILFTEDFHKYYNYRTKSIHLYKWKKFFCAFIITLQYFLKYRILQTAFYTLEIKLEQTMLVLLSVRMFCAAGLSAIYSFLMFFFTLWCNCFWKLLEVFSAHLGNSVDYRFKSHILFISVELLSLTARFPSSWKWLSAWLLVQPAVCMNCRAELP